MFLPEHGYFVEKVSDILTTKDLKHQYIECVFRKPAPKDEFGDNSMPDDFYQVKAWNKRMELVRHLRKGDKVKAQLSLSGSEQFDQHNSRFYYNLNLGVMKCEKIP